jgi:phage terminase Nu1 subunit (DNA packaging protein)
MAKTPSKDQVLAVDEPKAAELIGVSPSTLRRWRRTGIGPRMIRLGVLIRYRPADLEQFLTEHDQSVAAPSAQPDLTATWRRRD